MTRCLVTGATGFVGRALVSKLRASGAFVRGMARHAGDTLLADEFIAADLASLPDDTRAFEDVDVVVHLAAKTHDMTEAPGVEDEYQRINVEGTRRLVAASTRARVRRVVFVSSVKVIDEGNRQAANEQTPPRPLTPYGRSKLEAEQLVSAAAATGEFESVCLRFPLVYGPGQGGNLQRMLGAIRRHRFPPPPDNGNQRSMVHVDNAVQALLLAVSASAASGRTYLVTDARPYSTREVYEAARRALGRSPSRVAVPEAAFRLLAAGGEVARRVIGRRVGFDSDAFEKLLGSAAYDSGRIQRELGYSPSRDLIGSMPALVDDERAVH